VANACPSNAVDDALEMAHLGGGSAQVQPPQAEGSYTPGSKKRCGIQNKPSSAHVYPDKTQFHWLYKETVNRLDVLARRVSEGKCLDEALEFATYLEWSGLVKLMEQHS